MLIHATTSLHFSQLNEAIRQTTDEKITVLGCMGHRYIGSGSSGKTIEIEGTPGNALGAYLDGSTIQVHGNAQDATGDTMNSGNIYIHGSSGDATGYAMRGGRIFIRGNVGYRAGIHMKAYRDQQPIIIIGGSAGSFLGEYQAGGTIIVLGLGHEQPVDSYCATGMHGGRIYIRGSIPNLPKQVAAHIAGDEDMCAIDKELSEFCNIFNIDKTELLQTPFTLLTPNTDNPYTQYFTNN